MNHQLWIPGFQPPEVVNLFPHTWIYAKCPDCESHLDTVIVRQQHSYTEDRYYTWNPQTETFEYDHEDIDDEWAEPSAIICGEERRAYYASRNHYSKCEYELHRYLEEERWDKVTLTERGREELLAAYEDELLELMEDAL